MNVLFHIGLPKCASSTLQSHYAENDAYYLQQGLLYPKSYRKKAGYRHHLQLFDKDATDEQAAKDILLEASRASCSKIIISCERFSTDRSGQLRKMINAFANEIGRRNISVLCLLRDPASLLNSSYAQFVRAGLWGIDRTTFYAETDGTIQAYIEAFYKRWGCHWFDYKQLLDHALSGCYFGKLHIWSLDHEVSLVERLADHFGVAAGNTTEPKNQRLPQSKVALLREFQRHYGQSLYEKNRRPLINRIDLDDFPYSAEQARIDGVSMEATDLQSRFPTMNSHLAALLERNGCSYLD